MDIRKLTSPEIDHYIHSDISIGLKHIKYLADRKYYKLVNNFIDQLNIYDLDVLIKILDLIYKKNAPIFSAIASYFDRYTNFMRDFSIDYVDCKFALIEVFKLSKNYNLYKINDMYSIGFRHSTINKFFNIIRKNGDIVTNRLFGIFVLCKSSQNSPDYMSMFNRMLEDDKYFLSKHKILIDNKSLYSYSKVINRTTIYFNNIEKFLKYEDQISLITKNLDEPYISIGGSKSGYKILNSDRKAIYVLKNNTFISL